MNSYIKEVIDIDTFFNHLKASIPKVRSINFTKETKLLNILSDPLTEQELALLDSKVEEYTDTTVTIESNVTQYYHATNKDTQVTSNAYTYLIIRDVAIAKDILFSDYITFIGKGNYIVYGYFNSPGCELLMQYYSGPNALTIPFAHVLEKGMFFLPVSDPEKIDSVRIFVKSLSGSNVIKKNSCSITVVKSYSDSTYRKDSVLYSWLPGSQTHIQDGYFLMPAMYNIRCDADDYTLNMDGVLFKNPGEYLLYLNCTTTASVDLTVVVNDVDQSYLRSNSRTGIISVIKTGDCDCVVKFRINTGIQSYFTSTNILILKLKDSEKVYSDVTFSPQFFILNSDQFTANAVIYKNVQFNEPVASDIADYDTESHITTIQKTGTYALYFFANTENCKSVLLHNGNVCNRECNILGDVVSLIKGDTLELLLNGSGTVVNSSFIMSYLDKPNTNITSILQNTFLSKYILVSESETFIVRLTIPYILKGGYDFIFTYDTSFITKGTMVTFIFYYDNETSKNKEVYRFTSKLEDYQSLNVLMNAESNGAASFHVSCISNFPARINSSSLKINV